MPTIQFPSTSNKPRALGGTGVLSQGGAGKTLRSGTVAKPTEERSRAGGEVKTRKAGRVNSKDLAIFTRQFSVMIDAGLPLVQCLEILASQQQSRNFAEALRGVREAV